MASHHHDRRDEHHSKKGSFTNLFSKFFKTKEKSRESQNDLHDKKDEKERKNLPTNPQPNDNTSQAHSPHSTDIKQPTIEANQESSDHTGEHKDPQTTPHSKGAPEPNGSEKTNNVQPVPQGNAISNLSDIEASPHPPPSKHVDERVSQTDSIAQGNEPHPDENTHKHAVVQPTSLETREDISSTTNLPTHNSTDHLDNITTTNNTHESEYVPLPFYEGSPKNAHNPQHPQKPRNSGPPEILPEEIEYDTTSDFLGQGSFGSVYKGRCRGQEVAVKIPRKQKLSLSELTNFRNEVKIMSKIYHPNVVLFLGACTQMGKMQIVTERCMTDLEKLLASKRPLSLYERMRMAKDAALGMNWLHGITRIVHNDLKSANLLVDNHMRVKVTDFGFSSIKEGDQFVDKAKKGTPLWMAPEVMMGQPYDDKADVYSFGIILWEIVTRDVPYKHHSDYNTFSRAVCHEHERPPLPSDVMPSLKYLITQCWDHSPKQRPSFNEIVFRISEVMVECMIENESARQLWKKYFLLPKQELLEQVPWFDFAACIGVNLGLKSNAEATELLCNVKRLLITLPRDTMGLVNEIVTMERFDKVIKWYGMFFDPVVGPAVNKEINILASQSWFHWDISRDEATSRLSMHEEGTFLLRLSSTDPKITPFTLSLTGNQHRRIKRVAEGYKLQGKPKIYIDLLDLVANCEDYKLLKPCPKIDTSNPYAIETINT